MNKPTKKETRRGRPAAKQELMNAAQFDALMKLARLSPRAEGNRAARLVLVEGMSRADASAQANVNDVTLRMTLWRYAKLRELARVVAG